MGLCRRGRGFEYEMGYDEGIAFYVYSGKEGWALVGWILRAACVCEVALG